MFKFMNLSLPALSMLRHAVYFLALALTAGAVRAAPVQEDAPGYSFVLEEAVWRPQVESETRVTPQETSSLSADSADQIQSAPEFDRQPIDSTSNFDFGAMDRDNNPGTGIGSDFFGLDDNFDDGLLIKTDDVALKIGGYVKADFIQDFNPIRSTDSFDVTTIEIGAEPRTNTRYHARQTRLNFDTRWKSPCGPIRVFVEGDFFFNQSVDGLQGQLGTNRFRLRHAYGRCGNWTAGQTWTTFSDQAAAPSTLDFEGQVASINTRRGLIQWRQNIANSHWSIRLALEDPFANIVAPDGVTGDTRTETPDAVIAIRYNGPIMRFQIAGVGRELGFQPTGSPVLSDQAWGVNFTQVTKVSRRTKFYSEILWGDGIGSFRGLPDVVPTGPDSVTIVGFVGWMVGATHEWNSQLSSNFTYAEARIPFDPGFAADELNNVTYMAVNLIYQPFDRYQAGIEYLYGQRENNDGASGLANRVQVAFTYFLP